MQTLSRSENDASINGLMLTQSECKHESITSDTMSNRAMQSRQDDLAKTHQTPRKGDCEQVSL
eukprot:3499972-Amphidinium_carterae.1